MHYCCKLYLFFVRPKSCCKNDEDTDHDKKEAQHSPAYMFMRDDFLKEPTTQESDYKISLVAPSSNHLIVFWFLAHFSHFYQRQHYHKNSMKLIRTNDITGYHQNMKTFSHIKLILILLSDYSQFNINTDRYSKITIDMVSRFFSTVKTINNFSLTLLSNYNTAGSSSRTRTYRSLKGYL